MELLEDWNLCLGCSYFGRDYMYALIKTKEGITENVGEIRRK